MASIERIPTGWRARYRTPRGESRSRTFPTKRAAQNFLAEQHHDQQTGAFADPKLGRRTFGDWWIDYEQTRVDLRPSTRARDASYVANHVLPVFGDTPLSKIDRAALREWVADLVALGLAPATVVKIAQIFSKALAAAADERLIARNPADRLPLPRVELEEMRFLTPVEVISLADAIDPHYRVWVLTAAYAGLRFGELAGLRVAKVDTMRRRIEVEEILLDVNGALSFGPPKSKAGKRSVPIPAMLADELAQHVAGRPGEALVFTSPDGSPIRASNFRRRVFVPGYQRAGLERLRPHDLRHTAVSFWIAAGANPKEVAVWAGHRSVSTVLDRYGHLLPGQEDRVTDALESMLRTSSETPLANVVSMRK